MLLRGSAESEARTLTVVGVAVVFLCLAVTLLWIYQPFKGKPKDRISVAIDTPYVVQGVGQGTAIVMHGAQIGEVTDISSTADGGAQLSATLQKAPIAGLTDTLAIDFRPANYFGVTGVNITPGNGGQALRDGSRIITVPKGNFTLQALLSRLGQISTGVITSQAVDVIGKVTRYTDGLNPLIETMVTIGSSLTKVQNTPTAQLLTNVTGLSVAFPGALNSVSDVGDALAHADRNWMHEGFGDISEERWQKIDIRSIQAISNGIFLSIGRLESSHVADLLPLVNGVQSLADVGPPLLRPAGLSQLLVELRSRFEKMYAGTPEQRALQVRIVLDALPGVAAPFDALGGPR